MGRQLALVILAVGSSGLACAGVIGLGDIEISPDTVDAAPNGDGSVTALDSAAPVDAACGLTVTPDIVGFGIIHDNVVSAPLDVMFTNDGPTDVVVLGFTGVTSDFTAPPTPFTVKAGASSTQPFSMTAGTASTVQATITLTTDIPLCVPAGFSLAGQRTDDDITINPATLDLADVPCTDVSGVDAGPMPTGTITISNYGGIAGSFTVPTPTNFQVSPTSGPVPAMDKVPLAVSLQSPELTKPGMYSGSAEIDVTVGAQVTQARVQLQANVVGAVVKLASQVITVRKGTPKAIPLPNTGNVPICVSYTLAEATPGAFTLSSTTDTLVPGGGGTLVVAANAVNGFRQGTIKVTPVACAGAAAPSPLCGSKIGTIELEGQ